MNAQLPKKSVSQFQKEILAWYSKNKRDLPWRVDRDPYHIFISEVMLQQTQVQRVIPRYNKWLQKFPTLEKLAKAKTGEVLRLWSGLGYNRRALYLQKTAQIIVNNHQGEFPQEETLLRKLSGIGEYTAKAILCFAFNMQIAVVDTNVRKVILVKFYQNHKKKISEKEIQAVADRLLPKDKAYEWNQALMDYSSEVLKNKKILITKQSKFKGSNRFYRGQIIKILLSKKHMSFEQVATVLVQDHVSKDTEWLQKIVEDLILEGLVQRKNNVLCLE